MQASGGASLQPINGVFFVAGGGGGALANGGTFYGLNPTLTAGVPFTSGTTANLFGFAPSGVSASGMNSAILVGQGGTLLLATYTAPDGGSGMGGSSVKPIGSPTKSDLFAAFAAAPGNIYAVGAQGTILHSTDGGNNFQVEPSNTQQDLHAIWAASPSDVYAVGSSGALLHSTGMGSSGGSHQPSADAGATIDCGAGGMSCNGICVNVMGDDNNCGGCGIPCNVAGGQHCMNGVCMALGGMKDGGSGMTCGAAGSPCCPGSSCMNGGCCINSMCRAQGSLCPGGAGTCSLGACGTCGGLNAACCTGNMCTAGFLSCNGSMCVSCGDPGTACCPDGGCKSGSCNAGVCG
jgi:hypothetical protein